MRWRSGVAAALLAWGIAGAQADASKARDLGDLSLEQLSNIVVTTVSGREEPLSRALGSVYVIDADDIRRSGATSVGEALRLAPNLQVAKSGANGYAITARGFNGTLANKLLVLVDGRSLYTPTFAGVFWDAVDLPLEDVERIEVISGPGGVIWGANAVNGVINILTKAPAATTDSLIAAGGGDDELRATLRYGRAFSSGAFRVYALGSRLDDTHLPDGTDSLDGMDRLQAGFRTEWGGGPNTFNVQGDIYSAEGNQTPEQELDGVNVLGRLIRKLGENDTIRVQAYYEHSSRPQQRLDTADLALEHVLRARGVHSLLWGGGIRRSRDRIDNSAAVAFLPAEKTLTSWNLYLQDEVALGSRAGMTIGVKADRNSYTGVEWLPSLRFGWHPQGDHLVWAAASRAVREPSRIDRELFLPGVPPFLLAGGPEFDSEIAWVYELGYRSQPMERFSWAATAYYSDLAHQRSIAPGATAATVVNDREGHTAGIETWGAFRIAPWWRVWAGYNYLEKDLDVRPGRSTSSRSRASAPTPGSGSRCARRSTSGGGRSSTCTFASTTSWITSTSRPTPRSTSAWPLGVRTSGGVAPRPQRPRRIAHRVGPGGGARALRLPQGRGPVLNAPPPARRLGTRGRLAGAVRAELEQDVKAAYLFRFLSYVEWPAHAIHPDGPLVVGLVGADDVAASLEEIVRGRQAQGHPIEVRRLNPGQSLSGVHMVFVGGDAARGLSKLDAPLGVVVVSEVEGALRRGAIINLLRTGDNVRFEVAPKVAERRGVRISSRMLAVAERIETGR